MRTPCSLKEELPFTLLTSTPNSLTMMQSDSMALNSWMRCLKCPKVHTTSSNSGLSPVAHSIRTASGLDRMQGSLKWESETSTTR